MVKLLVPLDWRKYVDKIVELVNEFNKVEYPDIGRIVSVEEYIDTWFNTSWFNPRDLALVVYNDNVLGYGYTWLKSSMRYAMIRIDPRLPENYHYIVLNMLLKWLREKNVDRHFSPLVRLSLSYEYRFLHNLVRKYVEPIAIDHVATLMKLNIERYSSVKRVFEKRLGTSETRIVENGVEYVKDIVDIYNDAFSQYPWFMSWNVEDALRYYKRVRNRLYTLILYVEDKAIAYCDAELYTSVSGRKIAYIHTLAVKKKYQRQGIGSMLLIEMIKRVLMRGYSDIYLDAVEGLEKYYMERGFNIITRSISYLIEL